MLNSKIEQLITPTIEAMDFELWGFEYLPQSGQSILRVYVDGPDGINLDECAEVSRQIAAVLDVEDLITGKYRLEVSSPGMDRQLFKPEQYERYLGEQIKVKLRRPISGRRNFNGVLIAADSQEISLQLEGADTMVLALLDIDRATVVPVF